jgi:hypothetical protein
VTTGPEDHRTAVGAGHADLGASQAGPDDAIEALKAAYVAGRLTEDEFEARVGQALAARTHADLAALTADIPARQARARSPEPARESVSKKAVVAMAGATAALIGLWPVMMLAPPYPSFVLPVALVWFVLVMAVPTGWLALLHDWLVKRARRQSGPGFPVLSYQDSIRPS